MTVEDLQEGDVVYARADLYNDGGIAELEEGALLAPAGARGVIVRKGHLEEEPGRSVFLVRFEDGARELGPPLGCWAEELRADAAVVQ
nr:nitrogen fixation protein NifZ [Methylogaea oryzae]